MNAHNRKYRLPCVFKVAFALFCTLRIVRLVWLTTHTETTVRLTEYTSYQALNYRATGHADEKLVIPDMRKRRGSFKYSLEPGTFSRRIPDRFWSNSTQRRGKEFGYIIVPKIPRCENGLWLLVIVKSALAHSKQRKAIRKTWGTWTNNGPRKIRILFMLGRAQERFETSQDNLALEVKSFDDVIVGNFLDSYANVTIKSLLALQYIWDYCRFAQLVLSIDDDVFLNIPDLNTDSIVMSDRPEGILRCGLRVNKFAKVTHRGKWAVEYDKYDRRYFPPYCNGACFLMTGDVAANLHQVSLVTPYDIPIDDALITGILREKIRVELSNMPRGICSHLVNSKNITEKFYYAWDNSLKEH